MKWGLLKIILFLGMLCFQSLRLEAKTPKLLVLIISSDNIPSIPLIYPYKQLHQVWKSYAHLDPSNVETYFIRGNSALASQTELVEDVLWSRVEEGLIPGILNKTILSMEYFLPRLHEFDFVLRTNLSSFYVIPKLLEFLKTLPKNGVYCASGEGFGSGCGYILSPDVVKLIVQNKGVLFNHEENDDVAMGKFLKKQGISLLPAPRTDILSLQDWLKYKNHINPNDFHFRVKNLIHDRRAIDDVFIYSELLKIYYDRNISI